MPPGAPTKYTPELADEICGLIASGKSLRSICESKEMPDKSNVFVWLAKYPEFQDQYARAREIQADVIFDEMTDIADDATNDFMEVKLKSGEIVMGVNKEHIQRSRLRIDARKWVLGKMKPKKYGDKVDVEMKADLTHNYQITTKSEVDPDDIGFTDS